LSTLLLCTFSRSHISLYDVLFNFQGSIFTAALATACTLYHLSLLLSRGFVNFF